MKYSIITLAVFLLSLGCHQRQSNNGDEARAPENVAYKWSEVAILATANDTEKFRPRPTITSRYLALIF
ncbi:MAG: haloperoxidase, partial [Cyclobacteriaceae bacterium]